MAKIAVIPESPTAQVMASGEGWTVSEIVCTLSPRDRPFEERHSCTSISIVVAGTFQYRSQNACELMTPGSLLLGNAGQYFECGHEHGSGDRCISFSYTPEWIERLAIEAGVRDVRMVFKTLRLPAIRDLSPVIAAAVTGLNGPTQTSWGEISIQLAAKAVQLHRGITPDKRPELGAFEKITRIVRMIESNPDATHDLQTLAQEACLSPYHFLRTFHGITGVTPHQYLLRTRLRQAAIRLSSHSDKVVDIALDCGFGDISNFNRTFRMEFGVSPRSYRLQTGRQ